MSPWSLLPDAPILPDRVLTEWLDGGQSFRWRRQEDGAWQGQWLGHLVQLRQDSRARLEWRTLAGTKKETAPALRRYLALDTPFDALADALPFRSDPVLAAAMAAWPGTRLLRQPFGETLLGFLCSSNKRILQIRQMMDALAASLGEEVAPGLHRLPSWEELASVSEERIRACKLGYRAAFVAGTARFLAERPGWLDEVEALPYAEARSRLCELPGVGEKVADCVLLYGGGKLESFPVDTWILQVMEAEYGLSGWSLQQIARFGRVHFGPAAGLAQQYFFSWIRNRKQAGPAA
ncbi:DNA glycosylase [Nibricoccus sp. IMCC34717]|uniref:DNA glycosylase n=1 Tax=Nibricoccus sp. IMCC34717 TaxID=3034021 RepID=UPI00384FC719